MRKAGNSSPPRPAERGEGWGEGPPTLSKTTQALLPPNPKEFDSTRSTVAAVGSRTGSMSRVASRVSSPVFAGSRPSRSASTETTASMPPAAARACPVRPLVDESGGMRSPKTRRMARASATSLSGVPVPCRFT